jgi:hypothetical protein
MKILTQKRKGCEESEERAFGLLNRRPTRGVGVVVGLFFSVLIGWPPMAFAQSHHPRYRATVDLTCDNNVSRSQNEDRLDDMSAGLDLSASLPWPLTQRTRVVFLGNLGAEAFDETWAKDFGRVEVDSELAVSNLTSIRRRGSSRLRKICK